MAVYPSILEDLIGYFSLLPGVGKKSAERMALALVEQEKERVYAFADAMRRIKEEIRPCSLCNNFAVDDLCSICKSHSRDKSVVCVVEYPKDIIAIEKTASFGGVYFVLMGAISPLQGRGPQSIDLSKLVNRIKNGEVKEVIIATDSDSEGEITATFVKDSLKDMGVKVSRIGIGLPSGSQIEFADITTLEKAIQARVSLLD